MYECLLLEVAKSADNSGTCTMITQDNHSPISVTNNYYSQNDNFES